MTEHDISPRRTSEHPTTTPGIADTPGIPGIAATRGVADDGELRARALKRLKDKRDLKAHLLAYVTVNLLLVGIWAAAGGGFFWPVFPILGW
ncbi:MAG TPA: 2TM domain-containing protein, partial [Pedococcus sp.]|nr:2TM domain-containing protein [Pedococcus sp.]